LKCGSVSVETHRDKIDGTASREFAYDFHNDCTGCAYDVETEEWVSG
jgi:hypothetical protein